MENRFPVTLLLALLLLGCKPKDTSLTGQIFIVTENAANIKLGLVEVKLIQKQAVTNYLFQRVGKIETEIAARKSKLQNACDAFKRAASVQADGSPGINSKIENLIRSGRGLTDRTDSTLKKAMEVEQTNPGMAQRLMQTYDAACLKLHYMEKELESLTAESDKLENEIVKSTADVDSFPTAEAWLADFHPFSTQETFTDADGKFFLKYPRSGQFTILAIAERKVAAKTEKYYWLLDAPAEKTQFVLSNNNWIYADPDGYFKIKPVAMLPKNEGEGFSPL